MINRLPYVWDYDISEEQFTQLLSGELTSPKIDFGPDNPNTGRMYHDFVIGCENSRFVDVKIHKSYLHHGKAEDWQTLGDSLARLGQELDGRAAFWRRPNFRQIGCGA
ncbi:MAG: hypothetical protein R3C14_00355 [Caldilineaceae bacterium]